MADDDARRTEGAAVTAFAAGLVAGAIGTARRDDLLKATVIGSAPDGDGWLIDVKTDAGFGITIRVDLSDW